MFNVQACTGTFVFQEFVFGNPPGIPGICQKPQNHWSFAAYKIRIENNIIFTCSEYNWTSLDNVRIRLVRFIAFSYKLHNTHNANYGIKTQKQRQERDENNFVLVLFTRDAMTCFAFVYCRECILFRVTHRHNTKVY